jgi:hypothetical protein
VKRRQFTDEAGLAWDVYPIVVAPGPNVMKPALSRQSRRIEMFLAFESAIERRRLSPVPVDWDTAPVEELRRLLATATTVMKILKRDS